MANSEQGAECMVAKRYGGDGYFEWCDAHVRPYDQCTISALQAKLADLEKEREGMVTIEELGEKLRAVEIPLRSRIRVLEAALEKERRLQDHLIRHSIVGWQGYYNAYPNDDDEDSAFAMGQIMVLKRLQKRREALRPSQEPKKCPELSPVVHGYALQCSGLKGHSGRHVAEIKPDVGPEIKIEWNKPPPQEPKP
jgi:hypothetical protein